MVFKKNARYEIVFYDHAIKVRGKDRAICAAMGYFIKSTKRYYVFAYWTMLKEDELTTLANMERFIVMKNTLIDIRKLS